MKSNWNYPTTMWVGKDRIKDLSIACKTLNINKPLLVTDSGLAKSKIVINVLKNLKEDGFLVTYCAKGVVKRTMKAVGFEIVVLDGPPGKRQMTRANKSTSQK